MSLLPEVTAEPTAEPVSPPQDPVGSPPPAPPATGDSPTLGFNDLVGEDGNFKQDAAWNDYLTPLKVEKYADTFRKYKNPAELVRAMGNQTSMLGVGGDKLTIPKEDSPEAVRVAFREALGVPETADGYGIAKPADLPEGVVWSDDYAAGITAILHKHNATPALVKELFQADLEAKTSMVTQGSEASEQATREATEANMGLLKEAWGNDTDANLALAGRMAIKEGIDPSDPSLALPATIKLLHKLATMTSEDQLPTSVANQKLTTSSEAHAIMTDQGHPDHARYHSGTDPALMRRVQQMLIDSRS